MYKIENIEAALRLLQLRSIHLQKSHNFSEDVNHNAIYWTIPAPEKTKSTEAIDREEQAEIQALIEILLKNTSFASSMIDSYYCFCEPELETYKDLLNWRAVSINPSIDWNKVNWKKFASHLITSSINDEELTDEFCIECNLNETFPWSIELVEYYSKNLN